MQVSDSLSIGQQERIVIRGKETGLVVGIRVANDTHITSVSASQNEDGSVLIPLMGKSRQGEQGNLTVCKALLERLAKDGRNCSH